MIKLILAYFRALWHFKDYRWTEIETSTGTYFCGYLHEKDKHLFIPTSEK